MFSDISRLVIICLMLFPVSGLSQQPETTIFSELSPFKMELHLNYKKLCRDTTIENCPDIPGKIIYQDTQGIQHNLNVTFRTRGRWKTARCDIPALFVFFDSELTKGTIFENETMLPLTTHCMRNNKKYESYALVEYLAHQLFRQLSDVSLQARLVHATYVNTDTGSRRLKYGFFTEHFKRLAQRTNTEYYRVDKVDLQKMIPEEVETLALFEFMIGNLDWSVYQAHNIAHFINSEGIISAVPYDFDYSGLVNAKYAVPPDGFRMRSVRVRRYWGLCWPDFDWPALFEKFNLKRDNFLAEIAAVPGLDKSKKKYSKRYLNNFYKIINSKSKYEQQIIEKCRKISDLVH